MRVGKTPDFVIYEITSAGVGRANDDKLARSLQMLLDRREILRSRKIFGVTKDIEPAVRHRQILGWAISLQRALDGRSKLRVLSRITNKGVVKKRILFWRIGFCHDHTFWTLSIARGQPYWGRN